MSYEKKTFEQLALPPREKVIQALLLALLKHNGVIKEFGAENQEFCNEIADELELTKAQRTASMQTIVRKENRVKRFPAWHRLLYRSAAEAAKQMLLSHPTQTMKLTQKREWMLTENGIDRALKLANIPTDQKINLPIRTYEVEKIKNKLEKTEQIENYNPIDTNKRAHKITRESLLRDRGFRQAIIESYDYCCSACGLKISSPNSVGWEVEAAHIVPHRHHGKDDIWNGLALCHLHHWALDVGWFTLRQDFSIEVSAKIHALPADQGRIGDFDVLRGFLRTGSKISLPKQNSLYPHINAILWHRQNIFCS